MFHMQFAPVISPRSADIISPTGKCGKSIYGELADGSVFSCTFPPCPSNATGAFSLGELGLETSAIFQRMLRLCCKELKRNIWGLILFSPYFVFLLNLPSCNSMYFSVYNSNSLKTDVPYSGRKNGWECKMQPKLWKLLFLKWEFGHEAILAVEFY